MANNPIAGHPTEFLTRSVEYYVAGRFSAACKYRVAGHLLHHALEFLFKCGLLLQYDREEQEVQLRRLRKKVQHRLPKLWSEFREAFNGAYDLARFDEIIARIDRWEQVRYPGFPGGLGNVFMVGMLAPAQSVRRIHEPAVNIYELYVEEVDKVFTAAMTAMNLNPDWFLATCLREPEAVEMYLRDNRHSFLFSSSH
jgi:hypothetical protein